MKIYADLTTVNRQIGRNLRASDRDARHRSPSRYGSRGRPSSRSAMMLSCISDVPP
jgi:hypothetical protein